jgi:hypothetical protein
MARSEGVLEAHHARLVASLLDLEETQCAHALQLTLGAATAARARVVRLVASAPASCSPASQAAFVASMRALLTQAEEAPAARTSGRDDAAADGGGGRARAELARRDSLSARLFGRAAGGKGGEGSSRRLLAAASVVRVVVGRALQPTLAQSVRARARARRGAGAGWLAAWLPRGCRARRVASRARARGVPRPTRATRLRLGRPASPAPCHTRALARRPAASPPRSRVRPSACRPRSASRLRRRPSGAS